MTTPPEDQPASREQLVRRMGELHGSFERRALSTLTEPLLSTSLTMQQLKVLTLVAAERDRATGHDLAATMSVSVATMSGLVDRLVEAGMVQRRDDPADRRVRLLSVTATGRDTVRALVGNASPTPPALLERLDLDDFRALVQGLTALERAMQAQESAGPPPPPA